MKHLPCFVEQFASASIHAKAEKDVDHHTDEDGRGRRDLYYVFVKKTYMTVLHKSDYNQDETTFDYKIKKKQ